MVTGVDEGDVVSSEAVEVVDELAILDVQDGETMATVEGLQVADGGVIYL